MLKNILIRDVLNMHFYFCIFGWGHFDKDQKNQGGFCGIIKKARDFLSRIVLSAKDRYVKDRLVLALVLGQDLISGLLYSSPGH